MSIFMEFAQSVKRKNILESGSERKHLRLLWGKRVKGEHYYSLWIENSPQFTAENFNNYVGGVELCQRQNSF